MFKKELKGYIFLFTLFFTLLLSGGEFRIVATADIHGDLRALAALAPRIRKAAPDILVDAGDLTGGNLLAELDGGKSMIRALNLLKYDFRVPGNHDFDCPPGDLAGQCRLFKGVTLGGDWRWKGASGVLWKCVRKGGFKVGIIGLTEPNISRRHLPIDPAPVFEHWQRVLQRAIAELRREKVHYTILVWHNGIEGNFGIKHFLHELRGIDLVIGGHSHKENSGIRDKNIFIIQPGPYASSAAQVCLRYNDTTFAVEEISSGLLRAVPGESAADIDALNRNSVQPFRRRIFSRVCRPGDLSTGRFPGLGAEALRQAGGTQGAVFTASIPDRRSASGVCYKDLFRLLPYRNTLCTVELSCRELTAVLTDLQKNNRKHRRIMGVAGFKWNSRKKVLEGIPENSGRISVTVNSYLMVSSPVLRAVMRENKPRWQHKEITEREVVEKALAAGVQRH